MTKRIFKKMKTKNGSVTLEPLILSALIIAVVLLKVVWESMQ